MPKNTHLTCFTTTTARLQPRSSLCSVTCDLKLDKSNVRLGKYGMSQLCLWKNMSLMHVNINILDYLPFFLFPKKKKKEGILNVFPLIWLPPPLEIGNAYAVLSNPDKRRQYDLTGGEEPSSPSHSHGGGFDFHRGFEADITPEDLFNMFFGGGFPSCEWGTCVTITHQWFNVSIGLPVLLMIWYNPTDF